MQTRQATFEGTGDPASAAGQRARCKAPRPAAASARHGRQGGLDPLIARTGELPGRCSLHATSAHDAGAELLPARRWPGRELVGQGSRRPHGGPSADLVRTRLPETVDLIAS
jgi:hypothetical protein